MSISITSECINCGACLPECPNNAIFEGGASWEFKGNSFGENDATESGKTGFWSADFYYVVPDLCTECKGFHDSPQCQSVCPVECCLPDPENTEDEAALLKKKEYLDQFRN